MNTQWESFYSSAMREYHPAKLDEAYEKARCAIHNRILELADGRLDAGESGELDEALRQLTIHKCKARSGSEPVIGEDSRVRAA